jgi:ATP synthase protein I
MFGLVGMQALVTALVAAGAGALGGTSAAASAALGGLACALPNALFALRLTWAARGAQRAMRAALAAAAGADGASLPHAQAQAAARQVVAFFLGEFVKVALTLALLAVVATAYRNVVWLALIVAVIAALKSYMLAPLVERWAYGTRNFVGNLHG